MTVQDVFQFSVYHGYIPQLLIAEILFSLNLRRRSHFWVRVGIGLPLYLFCSWIIPNIVSYYISGFFSVIIFLFSIALWVSLFENKFSHVLFCLIAAQFTQNLAYSISETFNDVFLGRINKIGYFLLSIGVSVVVYLAAYFFFARKIKRIHIENKFVFFIAVLAGIFIYLAQYLFIVYEVDTLWVVRFPLVFTDLFGLVMLYSTLAWKDQEAQNATLEYLMEQERKQFEKTKSNIDLINIKAHDLRHYIRQVQESKEQDPSVLKEISEVVENYESVVNCGNATLNVILTDVKFSCDKEGIPFTILVDGKSIDFLHPSDIISIFANALDNALEYEKTIPASERSIMIKVQTHRMMVSVHVENSLVTEVLMNDGLPVTTKEDKGFHGFGLSSIKCATEKYGGTFSVATTNLLFCIDILIPIPQDKN